MARVPALSRLPSADRRRAQDGRHDQGPEALRNGEARVLANRNTTSQEEAVQRIASLPPIRQGKVLDIRRQIADGTYEVADRLDIVIDRVLEALTA
jgi:anti-sigma28 factor (negative regulator of flagellin synthesis)